MNSSTVCRVLTLQLRLTKREHCWHVLRPVKATLIGMQLQDGSYVMPNEWTLLTSLNISLSRPLPIKMCTPFFLSLDYFASPQPFSPFRLFYSFHILRFQLTSVSSISKIYLSVNFLIFLFCSICDQKYSCKSLHCYWNPSLSLTFSCLRTVCHSKRIIAYTLKAVILKFIFVVRFSVTLTYTSYWDIDVSGRDEQENLEHMQIKQFPSRPSH